jgi:hypothetical protein
MDCEPHDGKVIDHINRNRLDNRKSVNLRYTTVPFNIRNRAKKKDCSSKFQGVYFKHERKKWAAYINIEGVRKHLGHFENEEDAALAYQKVYQELEAKETSKHASLNVMDT